MASSKLCECGCGTPLATHSHRFARGHRPASEAVRRVMSNGYVRVWLPDHPAAMKDGYVLEHRLVLHEAGVEIPDGHHVHHRNGDKQDNRIENLEVVAAPEHPRRHLAENGYVVNQHGIFKAGGDTCRAGHREFAKTKSGKRYCRGCVRERARARRATGVR